MLVTLTVFSKIFCRVHFDSWENIVKISCQQHETNMVMYVHMKKYQYLPPKNTKYFKDYKHSQKVRML